MAFCFRFCFLLHTAAVNTLPGLENSFGPRVYGGLFKVLPQSSSEKGKFLHAGHGRLGHSCDAQPTTVLPSSKMISSGDSDSPGLGCGAVSAPGARLWEIPIGGDPRAALGPNPARCVTATEIGSVGALSTWLHERLASKGAQLESWGTAPGTKSMANLWNELVAGETYLEDAAPPRRMVHVASVHIRNKAGQCLVESGQEMADGRVRDRNRPLSEKMKPGETVEKACFRGIYEELGCQMGAADKVVISWDTYSRQEEERESLSYPGLITRYVIHSVVAFVHDLPSHDFCTLEDEHGTRSGSVEQAALDVRKHFWKWVPSYLS